MRNKRFFIVLAGALLFGLLAAVSVSRYLSSAQAYTKNLNRVTVAKVAIPWNQDHSQQVTVSNSPENRPQTAHLAIPRSWRAALRSQISPRANPSPKRGWLRLARPEVSQQ